MDKPIVHTILSNKISAVWFLIVLFEAKTIYNLTHYIIKNYHQNVLYIISILLSIIGVFIGINKQLIFMVDIAFAVQIWLALGTHLSSSGYVDKKFSLVRFIISGICWGIFMLLQYIIAGHMFNYFDRIYPAFPICNIAAFFGILLCLEFSKLLCFTKGLNNILRYLGEHSLLLMCIHSIDNYWINYFINYNMILFNIIRISIDITILLIIVLLIKKVKKYKKV